MKQILASAVLLALTPGAGVAHAKCDSLTKGAESLAGDQLVSQFKKVVACDPKVANQAFPTFMRGAGDADTLLALAMVSIDADIWNAVWEMVGKLSSYEARDEVAERIGMACEYNPKVVGFLEGAYFGLRDIDFSQWDDALVACQAPEFAAWLQQQVESPPPKLYDDKWNALADALVRRLGPDALAVLSASAVTAAGNGGPFESILMKMETAVAPELGETMNPADQARLEESLVGMAQQLGAEKARAIADRLANAGSDAKAAELLPTVYPGRAQGGIYWYGGVVVEAGDCEGGEKTAILHTALVGDPGARWIITTAAEGPLRSVKPKLAKCTVDAPWPVLTSPEPFTDKGELDAWVAGIVTDWSAKGYAVKTKAEKDIRLP